MEHPGRRLIGWDAGVSLTTSVSRGALRTMPLLKRAMDTLKTCEDLHHANVFDETAKARLRDPSSEFALFKMCV
jgi:hypothetical protein